MLGWKLHDHRQWNLLFPGTCTPAFSSFSRVFGNVGANIDPQAETNAGTDSMRMEYVRNLMRAIYRDQDLLDKAIALAALYQEMKTVQDHYQKIKAEDDARKGRNAGCVASNAACIWHQRLPNKGPRI